MESLSFYIVGVYLKRRDKVISFLLCILSLLFLDVHAQNRSALNLFESKDLFGARSFIENKGQFNNPATEDSIYFVFDTGFETIYFTGKGLIHKLTEEVKLTEEEREEIERGGKLSADNIPKTFWVNMSWKNSNKNCVIERSEKQTNYYTYRNFPFQANGYKKIRYVNVYNNIDIEYMIPSDKDQGIKYNVILNPGADPDDVQIEYTGAVKEIKTNRDGDVVIYTPINNIIEHAPKSYYENGEVVSSSFKINEGLIGFSFKEGYSLTQKLIIDPWVTSIVGAWLVNEGYNVDYDNCGNVFVYGGAGNGSTGFSTISKYSPSGSIVWTYYGTSMGYPGGFVVNRSLGKPYLGLSLGNSGATAERVNTSGGYDGFTSTANTVFKEFWNLGYDPVTGNVYAFGGSTTSNQVSTIINQVTGAINPVSFNNELPDQVEVAHYAIDSNGEIFIIYAITPGYTLSPSNKIAKINAAFTSSVLEVPSTYTCLQEVYNKTNLGVGNTSCYSSGFNCLAVNSNYLFYYDGLHLAAYNKSTGTKIASTTVPLTLMKQSGIVANADNSHIYLGGNTSILDYSFNGTSFTALSSISIGAATYVYDLKLNNNTGILYFSGEGFVGSYNTSCSANYTTTGCVNAVTSFSGCSSSSSYVWNFGDGSSNVNGYSAVHQYTATGNYNITVATGGTCNTTLQTITISLSQCPPPCYDCISSFAPVPGKKYVLSAWAKEKNPSQSKTSYTYPGITVLYPSISGSAGPFVPSGNIIDGWQRIEGEFTIPSNATDLTVKLDCANNDCYYDDIRILPFDGSMKSYVYDPITMRLVAELDERNYATLYEYDEEGKLIRVKKETEKGKMTIKENRDNTKK